MTDHEFKNALGRVLLSMNTCVPMQEFTVEQLEALVRERAAFLHGWYEATRRTLVLPPADAPRRA